MNWKTPQKRKSVPRLLSMIVVLHYTAVQVCKNRNLSYSPIIILTIQRAGCRRPFPDTNPQFTLTFDLDSILSLGKSVKSSSLKVKVKVETYETRYSSSIKVRKFLYTFEWQGGEQNSPHPLPTNSVQMSVNFHNFAELHLCSLKTYNF